MGDPPCSSITVSTTTGHEPEAPVQFESLGNKRISEYLRSTYTGTLVGVGSYSYEKAKKEILADKFDLIAIGRPFIANPDYINKITNGEALVEYSEDMLSKLI